MIAHFLGIDTSNYTTSIALVDNHGKVLFDKRIMLTVKPGELGLRQSDAFYQHVMNLPGLFFDLTNDDLKHIESIGVSCRPRNVEGSYMPVFNAGVQFAKVIAKSLNRPLYEYAHQDGHVMAAISPEQALDNQKILNLHISGGTTELFLSQWSLEKQYFTTDIIGGTKDISIGQLIDRIGVYLDFPFPCGLPMEQSIAHFQNTSPNKKNILPLKIEKGYFNLSGIENKIKTLLADGTPSQDVIFALFTEIARLLYTLLNDAIISEKPDLVILAGGVMSNFWIRAALLNLEKAHPNVKILITPKMFCTDNAVGIAKMALKRSNLNR